MSLPKECINCAEGFSLENPVAAWFDDGTTPICSKCITLQRQDAFDEWEKSGLNTRKK